MATKPAKTPLPGDLAIWIFIYAELAVFGMLFITYAVAKSNYPIVFSEGHQNLNQIAGLINTLALIISSYWVVKAIENIQKDNIKKSNFCLLLALFCAFIYVCVKLSEYYFTAQAGFGLSTNKFYTYYYLLTFFHFAHVLLGMVILIAIYFNNRKGKYSSKQHTGMQTGASYWHMVDLVWVVLFPLVYVLQ